MHVFTYGTLMLPSVMQAVTGKRFLARPALLRDYARFCIEGAPYPGVVPALGAETDGVLYLDVDPPSLARLDAFEGAFYERVRVVVHPPEGDGLPADVYVVMPQYRHRVSSKAWHLDAFRHDHLEAFLGSYHGFAALGGQPHA